MNIIRELRKKKGIQQKELAIEMGVSQPTVSDWESGKSDPSGERLKKLAEYFEVDEMVILGKSPYISKNPSYFIPADPQESGASQTNQIVDYVLSKLSEMQPNIITPEAQILAHNIDKLPQAQREQAVKIFNLLYSEYLQKGN
jgi:transcriptional regulator with XRE-family HTH domain